MFKKMMSVGMVVVLSLSFATGALANEGNVVKQDDVNINISGSNIGNGGLDLETSPINSFGSIQLTATPETHKTSFEHEFTIYDLRGTQEGWSLSVSASQFDSGTHQLPVGSLTLDGVEDIERVGAGAGALPTKELNATTIIDDGSVKVANAVAGTGMGVFDLTFDNDALGLTVDATTAKVGTYVSTLTWTLTATPQ